MYDINEFKKIQLLDERNLDELINELPNDLVKQAVFDGKIPVGYTCSYIPDTLLSLGDLFPVRIHAPALKETMLADTYLSSVICSQGKTILEHAMENRLDYLGGWVFAYSCSVMNRLYDLVKRVIKPPYIHNLDVMHKTTDSTISFFAEEIHDFLRSLQIHYDIDTDTGTLKSAIEKRNKYVSILKKISELRNGACPKITGTEFHKLMLASMISPSYLMADLLHDYYLRNNAREELKNYRARVMMVGSMLTDTDFIKTIEDTGALVVSDRMCTGSIPFTGEIKMTDDPVMDIAEHTMTQISCPRMIDGFDGRFEYIRAEYEKNNLDGVIFQSVKFCDCWAFESKSMGEKLKESGIPVLSLEREHAFSGEGQLKTRVQAFLESIGK